MIDTHTHIYKYISLTHIFSELQICKSTHWSMSLEHLKRYLRLSMSKHHSHDFPLLHPRPWQTSSTLLGLFPTFSTRCQKKKKNHKTGLCSWLLPPINHHQLSILPHQHFLSSFSSLFLVPPNPHTVLFMPSPSLSWSTDWSSCLQAYHFNTIYIVLKIQKLQIS